MTGNEQIALLMLMFEEIFSGRDPKPVVHQDLVGGYARPRMFKPSGSPIASLKGYDFEVKLPGRVVELRFLQQNEKKDSRPAAMARAGSKIAWLIDRRASNNAFLGKIQDGFWYPTRPNVIEKKAQVEETPPEPQPDLDISVEDLEELPSYDADPEAVIQFFIDDDEPPEFEEFPDYDHE